MTQVTIEAPGRGFLSALGRAASTGVRAVNGYMAEAMAQAQAKAEALALREAEDLAKVAEAEERLPGLIGALKGSYVPTVTQDTISSVRWNSPDPVADILTVEVRRIGDAVEQAMRDAGFPFEITDKTLRRRMQSACDVATADMHGFVFGGMKLPVFFTFSNGILGFEGMVERRVNDHFSQLYGLGSGWIYTHRRTLL